MSQDTSEDQDPWVPGIIQSLIDRRHLAPLHTTTAWDHAKKVMEAISAEQVFGAWQDVRAARESGDALELRVAVAAFQAKLVRWLND